MGKYILVTGGELFNKGAQAMTFITVNEIANRFPDKRVVLMSARDDKRPEDEKERFKFDFIGYPNIKTQLLSPVLKKKKKNSGSDNDRFLQILSQTDAIIDISGYALGSNWGSGKAITYMLRVVVGCINHIPVYLMPQSFGPFDFEGRKGKLADALISHFLPKATAVMVRENDGLSLIKKKYPRAKPMKTYDLVLQNTGIDVNNVFTIPPEIKEIAVQQNSVAVIPNKKNITYSSKDKAYQEYQHLIDSILSNGKNVYLIYHAVEDLAVCKDIKRIFYSDNADVTVVDEELSCLDFDVVVKKFDFIVGSRFHSIVHAYKNAIPAIVLGWAVKYKELMEIFDQEKYQFDSRNENSLEEIAAAVHKMCVNYKAESQKIEEKLRIVQKENVFDQIKL